MKIKSGIAYIGTSNIVVPGNQASYPPAFTGKSRLNYYSSFFNSLEINASFYKVPQPATFEKWSEDVPKDFIFAVKLWKEITHVKELNASLTDLDFFLRAIDRLGNKKGCLLIQFPGKISVAYYSQVERILQEINNCKVAVEFRNPTWYIGETFELMDEYKASIVMHDIPKALNTAINKKADFAYFRFHGPEGNYRGSYCDQHLKEYSEKIQRILKEGKDVFAYFNNTIGNAFENALTLKTLIHGT